MQQVEKKTVVAVLGSVCLGTALWLAAPVLADDDDYEHRRGSSHVAGLNPLYVAECGACHVAYPPGALPGRSWIQLMNGLDNHFGDDASLEPNEVAQLIDYLGANAAEHVRGDMRKLSKRVKQDEIPLKITELGYFKKEHRNVPKRAYKINPDLKLSNCEACHTKAEQGGYREHDINIPGIGPWED